MGLRKSPGAFHSVNATSEPLAWQARFARSRLTIESLRR
jgi:hypothetical protein